MSMIPYNMFASFKSEGDAEEDNSGAVIGTKVGFIIAVTIEAMVAGLIPVFNKNCRESPKILGIANAFAGGVFIAIAFMHIMPEMIETWNELDGNPERTKVFPLPELLVFFGYTIILVIDKVLFDTHALFDHDHAGESADPANAQFEQSVKSSMSKANRTALEHSNDPSSLRDSMKE